MEYTYEKRLGFVNADRVPPVVEAGSEAWGTYDGTIVVCPDKFAHLPGLKPLPPGLGAVTFVFGDPIKT